MVANSMELRPVDAITRGLTLRSIVDKPRLHQHFEMLRNGRLSQIKPTNNILAAASFFQNQLPENGDAHGMTQRCINARGIIIVYRHTALLFKDLGLLLN